MGFRFRKSINLGGGFRINLSKSGVGYSFGGKGFRYTKTARGTTRSTVSIPGTGISWVEESGKRRSKQPANTTVAADNSFLYSVENSENIVSADFDSFLNAIKRYIKINRFCTWLPYLFFALMIVGIVQSAKGGSPALGAISLFGIFAAIILKIVYRFCGRVKAHYEYDSSGQQHIAQLEKALMCIKRCSVVYQVNDVFENHTKRVHGGATNSVNTTKLSIKKKKPYFLRTNAVCYHIKLKKEKLYILPDVIFIVNKKKVGAVALKDLNITVSEKKFIENVAPKDATVISHTWQYVNNDGSPDRRFKNNRQLPVCLYGNIDTRSNNGFHTRLYISQCQAAKDFSEIVTEMINRATWKSDEKEEETLPSASPPLADDYQQPIQKKRKRPKVTPDDSYPPIDLRYKMVKMPFGGMKKVRTTIDEQRAMAASVKETAPHLPIISNLSDLDWIDQLEELDAIFDD